MFMIILSTYSTFSSAYYAAFGLPSTIWAVLDLVVEAFFFMDIIFCNALSFTRKIGFL